MFHRVLHMLLFMVLFYKRFWFQASYSPGTVSKNFLQTWKIAVIHLSFEASVLSNMLRLDFFLSMFCFPSDTPVFVSLNKFGQLFEKKKRGSVTLLILGQCSISIPTIYCFWLKVHFARILSLSLCFFIMFPKCCLIAIHSSLGVHGRGSNLGKSTGLVEETIERQIYVSEVETTNIWPKQRRMTWPDDGCFSSLSTWWKQWNIQIFFIRTVVSSFVAWH